jgi:hypothetical protein
MGHGARSTKQLVEKWRMNKKIIIKNIEYVKQKRF